jgi:hypothetical protein
MKHQTRGGRVNRYGRVASVLLEDDSRSDEEVAKLADVAISTAGYGRLALKEVREQLRLKGCSRIRDRRGYACRSP